MDNSFALLSSMSPKITKPNRNITSKKVPTKLALKKNIRRSSVLDDLPSTTKNNDLMLIEGSTTDTTDSSSLQSVPSSINNTPIVISDSELSNSENSSSQKDSIYCSSKQNRSDCVLSASKFVAINEWVSQVNKEKQNELCSLSNSEVGSRYYNLTEEVHKFSSVTKIGALELDAVLNNSKELNRSFNCLHIDGSGCSNLHNNLLTCLQQKSSVNGRCSEIKTDDQSKNESEGGKTFVRKSLNVNINSSSDVIENSDNNSDSNQDEFHTSLLDELYGDKWKNAKDVIFPQSEPRKKKKIIQQVLPKTEVKPKRKFSVHKNPYSDIGRQKLLNTLAMQVKPQWAERLHTLCDSDSDCSEQNLNEISYNLPDIPSTRLHFGDEHSDDNYYEKLDNINLRLFPEKTKISKRITQNLDLLVNSDKENFSDFSDNEESLEDRIRKKLAINKKVSIENNVKKTESNLKDVVNKKDKGSKIKRNIFENEVCKDTDSINKKSTKPDISKKKSETEKTKVLKKKPLRSVLEHNISNTLISKESGFISPITKNPYDLNYVVHKSFLASLSATVKTAECDPSARIFRNNFKAYKNELAAKLFTLYNEKLFGNAIPDDTPVEWSERMRGTAGFCYCRKITRSTGVIERKVRIVLATKILDSADRLRDTLIHEMCHAGTWIVNKVDNGHGIYWRAWADKAQKIFPELPAIKVCHNYTINTKYTYRCISCAYSFGRHSKSLNTEKKRCGYCYGKFEILINKTNKDGETKSVPVTPKKEVTGFALFVKNNYANYKSPQLSHGDVMRLLGRKFNELKVSVCQD